MSEATGGAGRSPRRWRRAIRWALAVLTAVLVLFAAGTELGRYLVRAGWEEAKILLRRRPIPEVVADPATPPAVRAKLELVLAARAFAADSVGLQTGESFTQYTRLEQDTLVLVVSGAQRDRLRMHRWWFPVVGWLPYKGYFDYERAHAEARRLAEAEYDVYVRPAAAFSTLGWFNDPVLSPTLRLDSLDLTDTVIHELLHETFFAPGQAVFNESFANFVGARGAEWFWRARGDTAAAAEVARRWSDELLLGAFWTRTYRSVDSAFAAVDSAFGEGAERDSTARRARIAARDSVFARMRAVLVAEVGPKLQTRDPRLLARTQFDNALLLARRIYLTDLELFEGVYAREGRDLPRTIARVVELAKSRPEEPYEALKDWLANGA